MAKKHKHRRLSVFGWIVVCATMALVFGLVWMFVGHKPTQEPSAAATPVASVEPTVDPMDKEAQEEFEKYHELNPDYVARLRFKNDLLYDADSVAEDPYPGLIVRSNLYDTGQADINAANEEYFSTNIAGEYVSWGQEFMDSRNVLDENGLPTDQNVILYGHLVYRNNDLKFGPLHKYAEDGIYDAHDTFTLEFDHERRTYVVTDAFVYETRLYTEDIQASPYATNYSKEELDAYMDKVKTEWQNDLDTGIRIEAGDRFVTLQTCVQDHPELLYLVLGKEIEVEKY